MAKSKKQYLDDLIESAEKTAEKIKEIEKKVNGNGLVYLTGRVETLEEKMAKRRNEKEEIKDFIINIINTFSEKIHTQLKVDVGRIKRK